MDNVVLQAADAAQFLTFTVGENEFGVDIMSVREIKGWSDCTRLPNTPEHMRGVMNLRGSIIPIFDLRCRFGHGLTEATEKHVVVILAVSERNIGILVDAVSDIVTIAASEIKSPPEISGGIEKRFISGLIAVEGRMVVLLEIGTLLAETLDISPLESHAA